jgi:hypothetical protein
MLILGLAVPAAAQADPPLGSADSCNMIPGDSSFETDFRLFSGDSVEIDPAEGAQGKRCLKVTGRVSSAPIMTDLGKTYTFSLYAKAAGKDLRAQLELTIPGGRPAVSKNVLLTDKWERHALTIKAERSSYRLGVSGTGRVDACQFEEGDRPTPYEPGKPWGNSAVSILAKLGHDTRKYPKIGVNLASVDIEDVAKCIRLVKREGTGDIVGFFYVSGFWGNPRGVEEHEAARSLQQWARLCRENEVFFFTGEYCELPMNLLQTVRQIVGDYYIGQEEGEIANTPDIYCCRTYSASRTGFLGAKNMYKISKTPPDDMKEARENLMKVLRKRFSATKACSTPLIFDLECGPVGHSESLECGADLCFSEFFGTDIQSMISARGTTRAYGRPLWGTWICEEGHCVRYDKSKERSLTRNYNLSYISGANVILMQDALYTHGQANPRYPVCGRDSAICLGFRGVAINFHNYVRSHPRSDREPAPSVGLAWGNLEGTHVGKPWGQTGAVSDVAGTVGGGDSQGIATIWRPSIEKGWGNYYRAVGGFQMGREDILPIKAAPAHVLRQYRTLIFPGWNTVAPEIYAKLREYVSSGGTLFMSLPQLSQQVERKPELELINAGDFRDLFGIQVRGKLAGVDKKGTNLVRFDRGSSLEQCRFPVGSAFAWKCDYPQLEWADITLQGATVLATAGDGRIPALIENRLGKGTAFLMTSYSFSPAPAEVLKPLVDWAVKTGDVELLSGAGVSYAVYPGKAAEEETRVFLVNDDYATEGNVKQVKLRVKDMVLPVEVKEGAIRAVSVLGDLALTASNESMMYLALEKSSGGKFVGKMSNMNGCDRGDEAKWSVSQIMSWFAW